MLGNGPQPARGPWVACCSFVFPSLAGHGVAVVALGTPRSCVTISPATLQGQEHLLETTSNRASMNFDDKLSLSWAAREGRTCCLPASSGGLALLCAVCMQ